jgi:hypothetical protein
MRESGLAVPSGGHRVWRQPCVLAEKLARDASGASSPHSKWKRIVVLAEKEPPGGGGGEIDWGISRAALSSSAKPDDRTGDAEPTPAIGAAIVKETPTAP